MDRFQDFRGFGIPFLSVPFCFRGNEARVGAWVHMQRSGGPGQGSNECKLVVVGVGHSWSGTPMQRFRHLRGSVGMGGRGGFARLWARKQAWVWTPGPARRGPRGSTECGDGPCCGSELGESSSVGAVCQWAWAWPWVQGRMQKLVGAQAKLQGLCGRCSWRCQISIFRWLWATWGAKVLNK